MLIMLAYSCNLAKVAWFIVFYGSLIEFYFQETSQKPLSGKFLWNDIGKLCFDVSWNSCIIPCEESHTILIMSLIFKSLFCSLYFFLFRFDILYPINVEILTLQRKKFEIRGINWSPSEKFVYYTSSDEKSKHLLALCKVTHQHSMAIQSRLAQVRGREESGNHLV